MDLVVTEMLTGGETHVRASLHMNAATDRWGDWTTLRLEFEVEKSPCASIGGIGQGVRFDSDSRSHVQWEAHT